MNIIGIDPGYNGALVKISITDKVEIQHIFTPVSADFQTIETNIITDWLGSDYIDHIYLEHVHAIFGSGAKNTFNFGLVFGQIIGMLGALKLKYNLVSPKTWQKEVWLPELIPLKKDIMTAKEKSLKTLKSLLPTYIIPQIGTRKKYEHDGVIDAVLIALYGLKQNKIELPKSVQAI